MGIDPDTDVIYFARTDFRNTERLFGIKRKDRRQHVYLVGKTGTGKSALLNNMIVQDIANGEGLCVVDPHGELAEEILEKIPEERMDDVIYFNPADDRYHIGFNPLELPDPKYKHLVASGLMSIFTKIWAGVWSARMEYILNNAILALLDNPGSTLLGITRILVDKEFRQRVVANVTDPVVRAFWLNEFEQWKDQFRNEAIAPIQNKVGQFLSTALIRNIVGQAKSTINIFDMMNSGKIFIVNVSKGRIGEDNSALLGAMLITQIQLSAMERVRVPEDERVDFYLYVDEFQNFATDSFAGILSEARKYRLNLIVAHQYIGQLVSSGAAFLSTKVRDAIFGNVGTMIMFRIGAADAEFLEKEFEPEFLPADMVNLPNHRIYLKMMVDGITCRPFSAATLPPFKVESSSMAVERIMRSSEQRYAKPRAVVEAEINSWSGVMNQATGEVGGSPGIMSGRSVSGTDGITRYQIICSSCGKTASVPFEPIPGKPVYCKECIAKIKSGEIQPVRGERIHIPKQQSEYMSDLAGIGIEFAPAEQKQARKEPSERHIAPPPTARPISSPPQKTAPAMSLTNLKPVERPPKIRDMNNDGKIDIGELRDAISKSLEQATGEEDKG